MSGMSKSDHSLYDFFDEKPNKRTRNLEDTQNECNSLELSINKGTIETRHHSEVSLGKLQAGDVLAKRVDDDAFTLLVESEHNIPESFAGVAGDFVEQASRKQKSASHCSSHREVTPSFNFEFSTWSTEADAPDISKSSKSVLTKDSCNVIGNAPVSSLHKEIYVKGENSSDSDSDTYTSCYDEESSETGEKNTCVDSDDDEKSCRDNSKTTKMSRVSKLSGMMDGQLGSTRSRGASVGLLDTGRTFPSVEASDSASSVSSTESEISSSSSDSDLSSDSDEDTESRRPKTNSASINSRKTESCTNQQCDQQSTLESETDSPKTRAPKDGDDISISEKICSTLSISNEASAPDCCINSQSKKLAEHTQQDVMATKCGAYSKETTVCRSPSVGGHCNVLLTETNSQNDAVLTPCKLNTRLKKVQSESIASSVAAKQTTKGKSKKQSDNTNKLNVKPLRQTSSQPEQKIACNNKLKRGDSRCKDEPGSVKRRAAMTKLHQNINLKRTGAIRSNKKNVNAIKPINKEWDYGHKSYTNVQKNIKTPDAPYRLSNTKDTKNGTNCDQRNNNSRKKKKVPTATLR